MTSRGVSQEEMLAFLEHVNQLSAGAGIDLDDDDRIALFDEAVARGFTPDATVELFDETYIDDDEPEYVTRAEFEAATQADEEDEMFDDDWELGPGSQRLADDLQVDLDRLQGKIGRPLLGSEIDAYVANAVEQVDRTGGYSSEKAHGATGVKGYGEMSSSEVNDAMVARARDLDPPDDDEGRVYEVGSDNPTVRNQAWNDYMVARVNGASEDDFVDVDVDAGDEAA